MMGMLAIHPFMAYYGNDPRAPRSHFPSAQSLIILISIVAVQDLNLKCISYLSYTESCKIIPAKFRELSLGGIHI